jgi:hypothetical protein
MSRKFIAVIGRPDSGKTTVLKELTKQFGSYPFERSQISICVLNGNLLFLRDSSPQERGGRRATKLIEDDLNKFEKVARVLRFKKFVVLMAFTQNNRNLNRIKKSINRIVKWNYDYEEITMTHWHGRFTKKMKRAKYTSFLREVLWHKFIK